ncbi:MAG: hypothetical protein WC565_08225 [Parcubacteria group bacterium]
MSENEHRTKLVNVVLCAGEVVAVADALCMVASVVNMRLPLPREHLLLLSDDLRSAREVRITMPEDDYDNIAARYVPQSDPDPLEPADV